MIKYFPVSLIVMVLPVTHAAVINEIRPCGVLNVRSMIHSCYGNFGTVDPVTGTLSLATIANDFETYCNDFTTFLRHQCFIEKIASCQNSLEIQMKFQQSDDKLCNAINQSLMPYAKRPEHVGDLIPIQCVDNLFFNSSNDAYCRDEIRRISFENPNLLPNPSDSFAKGVQKMSFLYKTYLECTMTFGFYDDMQNRDECQGADARLGILALIYGRMSTSFGLGEVGGALMEQILNLQTDNPLQMLRGFTTF